MKMLDDATRKNGIEVLELWEVLNWPLLISYNQKSDPLILEC